MIFKTEKALQNFVNDVPFFESPESFSLGNSLEDAAQIVKQALEASPFGEAKENTDVGMAD